MFLRRIYLCIWLFMLITFKVNIRKLNTGITLTLSSYCSMEFQEDSLFSWSRTPLLFGCIVCTSVTALLWASFTLLHYNFGLAWEEAMYYSQSFVYILNIQQIFCEGKKEPVMTKDKFKQVPVNSVLAVTLLKMFQCGCNAWAR